MEHEAAEGPAGAESIDPARIRWRMLLAVIVLLVPLVAASAASIAYHRVAAINARYVVALSQLLEGMERLDGHVASIEAGREGDPARARDALSGALGLYGALRAADPDGDEIDDDSDAPARRALSDRTEAAGIDPTALGAELGLLGREMPDDLARVWEEDEDWTSAEGDTPSLEASFAEILLAAAPILVDGDRGPVALERFWAASDELSDAQVAEVSAALRDASAVASRMPVAMAGAVLGIALAAAVFAWVVVVRPLIREIVRGQAALAREVVAAQAADKAKSEFLTTISHELRTPMNGVLGVAQLLEAGELDEDQAELVGVLKGSAEGQMALIEELLSLGEIEADALHLRAEPVVLAELVQEAAGVARVAASAKGLALEVRVPDDTPPVLVDPKRLRQVVVNLAGNAVKFTDEGRVEVTASLDALDGAARLRVSVADTGPGIAPEHHASVFERFTQVDGSLRRAKGGTGLGLAICRGIAVGMGGDLTLRSAPGQGSTFTLDVPVRLAEAATPLRPLEVAA